GERRRIDRRPQALPQVDHGAVMILVCVGEDDTGERAALFLDEAKVRQYDLDAGLVLLGEGQAEVDHQPAPVVLRPDAVKVNIESDLAETTKAQKDDLVLDRPPAGACLPHLRHCRSFPAAVAPNVTSP